MQYVLSQPWVICGSYISIIELSCSICYSIRYTFDRFDILYDFHLSNVFIFISWVIQYLSSLVGLSTFPFQSYFTDWLQLLDFCLYFHSTSFSSSFYPPRIPRIDNPFQRTVRMIFWAPSGTSRPRIDQDRRLPTRYCWKVNLFQNKILH